MGSYVGFMTTGLLRASSTVYLQRKALQVAFLKIVCPEILFFPKPPEELVFHKNAFGNTEATRAQSPKDVATLPEGEDFCCFLWASHVKCKDVYSDLFSPTYLDPERYNWSTNKDPLPTLT